MGSRGRKPNPSSKYYFQEEQEEAVLQYLSATTKEEKDAIYNGKLLQPFNKMVESIIRRYKFNIPDEEFEETFNDTLSYLMTKLDMFKPGKFKAFSYYGTICKNYLIAKVQDGKKRLHGMVPYEQARPSVSNSLEMSDYSTNSAKIASETINLLVKKIKEMIDDPNRFGLKEKEIKLAKALKSLFENWEFILSTDGSNKLNKSAILFFLRDQTGMTTKDIRDSMKRFRFEFDVIKEYLVS